MTEKKNFQILIIYVPKGLWLQIYSCVYFIILRFKFSIQIASITINIWNMNFVLYTHALEKNNSLLIYVSKKSKILNLSSHFNF